MSTQFFGQESESAGVDEAMLQQAIAAYFAANPVIGSGFPVGGFLWHCAPTPPAGFTALDGSGLLRSPYPLLDSVVYCGDAKNATAHAFYHFDDLADPENTRNIAGAYLKLPIVKDFIRGYDPNGEQSFASFYEDKLRSHAHELMGGAGDISDWFGGSTNPYGMVASGGAGYSGYVQATGDEETCPKHMLLLGCLRHD